jgi:hypothetical protein
MNALTAQAGLRIGPVVLETLVKYYFERLRAREGKGYTHLREEEMLYDQAFGIVRVCSFYYSREIGEPRPV